jgi:hypothetical protein
MTLRVNVYELTRDGYRTAGTISLAAGKLLFDPPDSVLLNNIVSNPIAFIDDGKPRRIGPDTPEKFITNLHRQYCGSYLRVGEAQAVDDG